MKINVNNIMTFVNQSNKMLKLARVTAIYVSRRSFSLQSAKICNASLNNPQDITRNITPVLLHSMKFVGIKNSSKLIRFLHQDFSTKSPKEHPEDGGDEDGRRIRTSSENTLKYIKASRGYTMKAKPAESTVPPATPSAPKPEESALKSETEVELGDTSKPEECPVQDKPKQEEPAKKQGNIEDLSFMAMVEKQLEDDVKARQKEQNKQDEASWRTLKYSLIALGVTCLVASGYTLLVLGAPNVNEQGLPVKDSYSQYPVIIQYVCRAIDELQNYSRMIKEPSRNKLLPDRLEPPYFQPKYTLVMEFKDFLVHPEWTYKTGWRFKKRPGLDEFLEAVCSHFELVVYTAEMGITVFPILDVLDKNNLINYKLVRDATNFVEGQHVKDLDKLNRDLSKVIVVDWNSESAKLHPDNLFMVPRWQGNDDDIGLFDLAGFLLAIAKWEVEDVRSVLTYYSQFENPLQNFRERQKQLLES